jgi:AraC family transcriptional regulator of adaptative response/methylated-DNA-[protein]-cysteine methyltransferase
MSNDPPADRKPYLTEGRTADASTGSGAGGDARWRAVLSRADAGDSFVYAVSTTSIYCRPSCPSKRPRRENVEFFPSAEEAEAAGYRPCKRCRPNEVSRRQWAVARIQHLLETAEPEPTLARLGEEVGLAPAHAQRLFKSRTGMTPKQYARAFRTERLQAQLRRGAEVASAQYEAGFGSSRALYSSAGEGLGMTPGRYRDGGRGVTIRYGFIETDLGEAILAATDRGVCALRFGDEERTTAELRDEFPNARLVRDDAGLSGQLRAVRESVAGVPAPLPDLPLDIGATEFQRRVWSVLREIPAGETRSYRQVAEAIGAPGAVRAVASACAANPVALVIPCHRVVRASGELSGYRWGVERKRALLERERAAAGLRDARAPAG